MTETQIAKWAARVAADLAKADAKRHDAFIGREAGPGWRIETTDGHRALLRRGEPTTDGRGLDRAAVECFGGLDVTPDFIGAVKRMKAAAGRKDLPWVALTPMARGVLLATCDHSDETQAREWFPAEHSPTQAERIRLSLKYLTGALVPGLRLTWRGGYDVATLATPDDEWKIVIMPIKPSAPLDIEQDYEQGAEHAA